VKTFSLTRSEEDHLKAIHSLVSSGGRANTNAICGRLNTKASSVTDMLKKLAEKGLVKHEPYHGASLTARGEKLALSLIRKHRLWETFLVTRLGFGWNEVHEVAEQLEHVSSEKLVEKLDEYLGRPAFDPHGDPIPDSNGRMKQRVLTRLSECPVGAKVRIVAVDHSSDALLEHLDRKGIAIGMRFDISARLEFDGSMELRVRDRNSTSGPVYNVSAQVAGHLYVEKP
jgi:DtxR family transcriptional regulator, Mn-dependent transcriptional regulator